MLVLSRKIGEEIRIGDDVVIVIKRIKGKRSSPSESKRPKMSAFSEEKIAGRGKNGTH
jgi:hypothetical protein